MPESLSKRLWGAFISPESGSPNELSLLYMPFMVAGVPAENAAGYDIKGRYAEGVADAMTWLAGKSADEIREKIAGTEFEANGVRVFIIEFFSEKRFVWVDADGNEQERTVDENDLPCLDPDFVPVSQEWRYTNGVGDALAALPDGVMVSPFPLMDLKELHAWLNDGAWARVDKEAE